VNVKVTFRLGIGEGFQGFDGCGGHKKGSV
jgi:hypothetical protein